MVHLLWIVVVTLITFSIILSKPKWSEKIITKRKNRNDKYKLPAEFWYDINEVEIMLRDMHYDNAKTVFQCINMISDKYMRYYMNFTYDQQMTRLITKYNNKVLLLTKNK